LALSKDRFENKNISLITGTNYEIMTVKQVEMAIISYKQQNDGRNKQ